MRRRTGLAGAMGPVELPEEIVAVMVLENDRIENAFLADQRWWMDRATQAAGGAGVFNVIEYHYPPTSVFESTIEYIFVDNTMGAGGAFESMNNGDNSFSALAGFIQIADSVVVATDARYPPGGPNLRNPAIHRRVSTNTVGGVNTGQTFNFLPAPGSNVLTPLPRRIVVAPGTSYAITGAVAAQALVVAVIGRERQLEQTETLPG
jgi:hypothetical protein